MNNTYVCVTRYYYANAEEFNATFIAPLKRQLEKSDNILVSAALKGAIEAAASSLKGYFVSVVAYLFRLEWNNDLYNDFYTNKWNDPKKFFDTSNYKLIYVGRSGKRVPASLSMKRDANDAELLRRAVMRSTDAAFAALQRDYEEFRPMSSLHVIDGKLAAYIGTKEGIKEGDKFDVFEAVVSEKDPNMTDWKPVGKIKVAKKGLWDNSEGAVFSANFYLRFFLAYKLSEFLKVRYQLLVISLVVNVEPVPQVATYYYSTKSQVARKLNVVDVHSA